MSDFIYGTQLDYELIFPCSGCKCFVGINLIGDEVITKETLIICDKCDILDDNLKQMLGGTPRNKQISKPWEQLGISRSTYYIGICVELKGG